MIRRGTVEFDGAFFTANPHKTLRQNIRVMLADMASRGESEARAEVAPHRRSGDLEGSIHGRVASLSGKKWALTAVVSSQLNRAKKRESYAGYIETGFRRRISKTSVGKDGKTRTRNVGVRDGSFRGVHMFQLTGRRIRTSGQDLARGIA
jgi:hypothetical protein